MVKGYFKENLVAFESNEDLANDFWKVIAPYSTDGEYRRYVIISQRIKRFKIDIEDFYSKNKNFPRGLELDAFERKILEKIILGNADEEMEKTIKGRIINHFEQKPMVKLDVGVSRRSLVLSAVED